MWEPINWADLWVNRKILKRSSNLEIMSYGFPNEKKHIWANSRKDGLIHSGYNITYPIILLFLFLLIILNQTQYWSMLISWNSYTYVDQTLKGIQSLEDESLYNPYMKTTWKNHLMKILKIKEKQRPLGLIKQ
jgi:hypothetical protein